MKNAWQMNVTLTQCETVQDPRQGLIVYRKAQDDAALLREKLG